MANSIGTFASTPDDHGDRLGGHYRWTRAGAAAIANPLLRRDPDTTPRARGLRDGTARLPITPKPVT